MMKRLDMDETSAESVAAGSATASATANVAAGSAIAVIPTGALGLAGATGANGASLSVPLPFTFEREPGNLFDAWAIRVFAGGDRLGFVPCDQNEIIARLMDGGKSIGAKVTAMEKIGRWNKIHMEVYLDD